MPNGAQATKTDQRGVTHTYSYDNLGRLTLDQATDANNYESRHNTSY
ncbi:MAG: hypothetical protein ABR915_01185 [Thermoguttaceae bacterium]|jgi:YD repeat-containing protein